MPEILHKFGSDKQRLVEQTLDASAAVGGGSGRRYHHKESAVTVFRLHVSMKRPRPRASR